MKQDVGKGGSRVLDKENGRDGIGKRDGVV